MVSAIESKKLTSGAPLSFASTADTPRNSAKTIIWSICPSTAAFSGLSGKRLSSTLLMLGASLASNFSPSPIASPTPGCIRLPSTSPMTIATAVVAR